MCGRSFALMAFMMARAGSGVAGPDQERVAPPIRRALLVGVGGRTYALDLGHVIEIMRPLPVREVAGAPAMVAGLSLIRGVPVPVVDLAALFRGGDGPATRFVVVRAGKTPVALAVGTVVGIGEFSAAVHQSLPPLLRDAAMGLAGTIAALDSELLLVLDASRVVPPEFLESLAGQER